MLDVNSQKRIAATLLLNEENWKKLNSKDILSFSGVLELIRNLRNTINHFEPVFPYLQEHFKSFKRMNESKLFKTLYILQQNYNNSLLLNLDYSDGNNIKSNPSTKRNIDILNIMKEFIK